VERHDAKPGKKEKKGRTLFSVRTAHSDPVNIIDTAVWRAMGHRAGRFIEAAK